MAGTFVSAIGQDNAALLRQLDVIIRERSKYDREKENRLNDYKNNLSHAVSDSARFNICDSLYKEYLVYQTDSALKYIDAKASLLPGLDGNNFRIEVELNYVNVLIIIGMYKEAIDILEKLPYNEISGELKRLYFHCYRTLYGHMSNHAVMEETRQKYVFMTDIYRDSLLSTLAPESSDYVINTCDRLNNRGRYDEAIAGLKNMTDTCTNSERMRFLAYTLSESYRGKNDAENRKRYLTLSAIADLKYSVKEYKSLLELTYLIYEIGDINRAYDYIKCALEDATFCNARSRAIEATKIYPLIDNAYQLKNKRRRHLIGTLMTVLSVLALCLGVTVLYIYRQIRKLASARRAIDETNRQLQALNRTLTETNVIKEEYIAKYISRCSVYIDKMDKYRKNLSKLATNSKIDELFKVIKSDKLIEDERREFYKEFDRTFLGLFPDFVFAFNNLLREDERIYTKNGELLNTELRIFALIRLGITDSARIAEFLQYSLTTIYNYRSKIRNRAVGDKNTFETEVMNIK